MVEETEDVGTALLRVAQQLQDFAAAVLGLEVNAGKSDGMI